jgi:hypothetical protein
MRKIQVLGIALLALFAFGALTAMSASAANTYLLAEWLLNGVAIGASETNLVEIDGTLLLEDTKAVLGSPAAVRCTGSFDGWVGPNSLDFITEVLNVAEESISTTPLTGLALTCVAETGCESSTPPLVYPVGMPWESEVELLEQSGEATALRFMDLITTKNNGGKLGWEIENCLVLGTAHEDECVATEGVTELTLAAGPVLLGAFSRTITELNGQSLATCTGSGAATGVVENFEGKGGTFLVAGGGELAASSEGVIS